MPCTNAEGCDTGLALQEALLQGGVSLKSSNLSHPSLLERFNSVLHGARRPPWLLPTLLWSGPSSIRHCVCRGLKTKELWGSIPKEKEKEKKRKELSDFSFLSSS
uniref:Uncharacterized protein n=1 Tax=Micrurus lemniscatus lemniscatus TaxID=129467 RepID=A0A2D4IXA2_MICLE